MSWQAYLSKAVETVTLPWVGGRTLHDRRRRWACHDMPPEHGWYRWTIQGRTVTEPSPDEPHPDLLISIRMGCLIGDRVIFDHDKNPSKVHLVEPGLERFTRVSVGKIYPEGPWIYRSQELPLGMETDVLEAFEDRLPSLDHVQGVTPALNSAFKIESEYRILAEKRRAEREEEMRLAELRRQAEARAAQFREMVGDGHGRRELARVDFEAAAKAALEAGGAEFLSARVDARGDHVVRYRLMGRRLECVCDDTLRIVDAGVCLTDHETGVKGDTLFTLESLPSVIREAEEEGVLVVWRHG